MSNSTPQYDKYDCTKENIWVSQFSNQLEKILRRNWNEVGKYMEIEARLGKIEQNYFISGVGHSFFEGMKQYLLNKNMWTTKLLEPMKPKEVVTYDILYSKGRRVSLIYENGVVSEGEVIIKTKRDRLDFIFSGSPYCLRLGTASEIPVSKSEKQELFFLAKRYFHNKPDAADLQPINIRKKIRYSFNHHNEFTIDMTTTYESKIINDIEKSSPIYEIEYEFGEPNVSLIPYIINHINNIGKYLLMMKPEQLLIPSNSKFDNYNKIESCLSCGVIIEDMFPKMNDPLLDIIKQNNGILPSEIAKQLDWVEAFPIRIEKLNGEVITLRNKDNNSNNKTVSITCNAGEVKCKNNKSIPVCAGHVIGKISEADWMNYKCTIIPSSKRKRE